MSAPILVPNGLVGYWPLDADNVDFTTGVVTDLSPSGNNGTLVGTWPSSAEVDGPNAWNPGALNFNGARNITANAYDLPDGFSFWFWVNAGAPSLAVPNGAPIVNGTTIIDWAFLWSAFGAIQTFAIFTLAAIQADFVFQDSLWYFVACTWDGATMSVYVNGVLCGTVSQSTPVPSPSGLFSIGKGASFFTGALSGVGVHNRGITPAEVSTLFRGGPPDALTGPTLPRPVPGSNALGIFKIGVSPIGTIPQFDFWSTVMAQYANSPILTGLIQNMWEYIDPTEWFDEWWSIVMNLPTAEGFGLDILGRIVGVGRVLKLSTASYFGFAEALPGPLPFNVGTFFSGGAATTNFALADGPYRVLILAKALANISNGSMRSINAILSTLFRGRGNAYCTNGLDMSMTLTFAFTLTPVELAIITQSGAIPIPVGVSFMVVQT